MVEEETVVTEPETTGSPEGTVETPSTQTVETPEAAETQPGQQETETLADGTPVNKPIPHDAAKRMAETAADKRELEIRREYEQETETPAATKPDTSKDQEHPVLSNLRKQFPEGTDLSGVEAVAKAFAEHYDSAIARSNAQVEGIAKVTASDWEKGIFKRFPDLRKAGDKDHYKFGALRTTFDKLGYDDPDQAAYNEVFKDKVTTKQAQDTAEQQKHLTQLKKNAVTVGGATGSPTEGKPPVPMREGKDKDAYLDDGIRRAFR